MNILLVNFVYDDEELLEPYEWQDDDSYEEIENAPLYHVSTKQLHDFLYAKFYQLIKPSHVHIIIDGKIVVSGDESLIKRIDEEGFDFVKNEYGVNVESKKNTRPSSIGLCGVKEKINGK